MKIVIVGESFAWRDDRRYARPDDQRPIGYGAGRVGLNRHLGRRREHHVADSPAEKVDTLRVHGRFFRQKKEASSGLRCLPTLISRTKSLSDHPLLGSRGNDVVESYLVDVRRVLEAKVARMPAHRKYVARLCGTPSESAA